MSLSWRRGVIFVTTLQPGNHTMLRLLNLLLQVMGAAFGPFVERPTTTSSSTGTTPTKAVSGTDGLRGQRLIEVTNLHESQRLAYTFVPAGAAAPTITADGSATDGGVILPYQPKVLPARKDMDLYVVGEGADTTFNIVVKDR